MRYVKITILLLIVFLICRISSYGQSYIERLNRGDSITIDTAVCMDVPTYRSIRVAIKASPRFVQAQDSLLAAYKKKVELTDSLLQAKEAYIARQSEIIIRKDSVINNILNNYNKLDQTTVQTLNYIEQNLPKNNFWSFISKPPFWVGFGLGVVGGVILAK